MKNHVTTEKSVLDVYRRVSPSYKDISKESIREKVLQQRLSVLEKLGLIPAFFNSKKILEIGSGTGENTVLYAVWGGIVTTVEPNEISNQRAKNLYDQFGVSVNQIEKSLFDIDPEFFQSFDIIICEGVLHHTFDPKFALDLILKNLAAGAIAMIAIGESNGWYKRNLQRKLIRSISNSEEEIVRNAKVYFSEHIRRSVLYGGRSEESIIFDTFVNPQIECISLELICNSCLESGVRYLSSYPTLHNIFATEPWGIRKTNQFDYNFYRDYYGFLETIWMVSGEEDPTKLLLDPVRSISDLGSKKDFLFDLEQKITNNDFEMDNLRVIQEGYMGIGMLFFLGQKTA